MSTSDPPLHAETGSGGAVQNSRQSDLRRGEQQPCVCHGGLRQKVVRILPQWLWILQRGVSRLRGEFNVREISNLRYELD